MSGGWVCLMWHEILAGEPASGGFSDYFAVSRHTFGRQLDAIRAAGYRGCTLAGMLSDGTGPRIGITFDDGTIGHYERALPELVARNMTATFFVTSSWVGRPGYATWDQLRAMRDAGMEIGSHTRTHRFLSELDAENVEWELRGAREEIDAALDQRTVTLALPGGDAPRRALRPLLASTGYSVVATSRWGVNAPPRPDASVWIRRCTVPVASRLGEFQRILDGDVMLSVRRRSRESVLGALRDVLGPTRYTRWRRRFLDAASRRRD